MKNQHLKTRVRHAMVPELQLWKVSGSVALGSPPVKQPITPGLVDEPDRDKV